MADQISRLDRGLRRGHGGPNTSPARFRSENSRAVMDRAWSEPLLAPRLDLSHRDDFCHLGHLRSCRPGEEAALALKADVAGGQRGVLAIGLAFLVFLVGRAILTSGRRSFF